MVWKKQVVREDIQKSKSLAEKSMLTQHLQLLENLSVKQSDEMAAIKALERDRQKMRELQKLQKSLLERKKQFEEDAKRLEKLNKEIKRSEKLIEKLNEIESTEKGIQHD